MKSRENNETNMLALGRLMTKQEVGASGCGYMDDRIVGGVVIDVVVGVEPTAVDTGELANVGAGVSLCGDTI